MPINHLKFVTLPLTKKILRETSELSFVLKPSELGGVGVFMTHPVREGTELRLFGEDETPRFISKKDVVGNRKLRTFCLHYGVETKEGVYVPQDFGVISLGWYMNHFDRPTAYHDLQYRYFAMRDLYAGDEFTINYRTL